MKKKENKATANECQLALPSIMCGTMHTRIALNRLVTKLNGTNVPG